MTLILGEKKKALTSAELRPIRRDVDLSSAQTSGCYLTENTFRLHYKNQPFVWEVNGCWFEQSQETYNTRVITFCEY